MGGLTEAKKIYSMAAAYDIPGSPSVHLLTVHHVFLTNQTPVIPHGSSVFSYHLQFAYANSPMAEILIMSPNADKVLISAL